MDLNTIFMQWWFQGQAMLMSFSSGLKTIHIFIQFVYRTWLLHVCVCKSYLQAPPSSLETYCLWSHFIIQASMTRSLVIHWVKLPAILRQIQDLFSYRINIMKLELCSAWKGLTVPKLPVSREALRTSWHCICHEHPITFPIWPLVHLLG